MRGYGASGKAPVQPDHAQQSKRAVAGDLAVLMRELGHERFTAVGHGRGCSVALRLALDHPDRLERLVVVDGVPISEALARCDATFARDWYHWFFFAQPDKPERAILADPDAWYAGESGPHGLGQPPRALAGDPRRDTVRAMLEDHRAGLGIDREDEEQDRRAGRRIACPTLLLWSIQGDLERLYGDAVEVWRSWAHDLRGEPVDSRHHMAEENPQALVRALPRFLD